MKNKQEHQEISHLYGRASTKHTRPSSTKKDSKLNALRDLNTALRVHAEKIKLEDRHSRTEESIQLDEASSSVTGGRVRPPTIQWELSHRELSVDENATHRPPPTAETPPGVRELLAAEARIGETLRSEISTAERHASAADQPSPHRKPPASPIPQSVVSHLGQTYGRQDASEILRTPPRYNTSFSTAGQVLSPMPRDGSGDGPHPLLQQGETNYEPDSDIGSSPSRSYPLKDEWRSPLSRQRPLAKTRRTPVRFGGPIARSPVRGKRGEVDIRRYRPGYTWSRGGRMKELKIRNMARKFYLIWKRKAFGRVLPSVARAHFHDSLLVRSFGIWKDVWWLARIEWRLMVRAECHNRFRLRTRVWKGWCSYVAYRQGKKAKITRADTHYSRAITAPCFSALKSCAEKKRRKKLGIQLADVVFESAITKYYLSQWVAALEYRRSQADIERHASTYWVYRTLRRYWTRWKAEHTKRQLLTERVANAARFYRAKVEGKVIRAWRAYIEQQLIKNEAKGVAIGHSDRRLLRKALTRWRLRLHTVCTVREMEETVDCMDRGARLRRALKHWKSYVSQRNQKKLALEMAEMHRGSQLLKICFSAMKLFVVQRRTKYLKQAVADRHRDTELLRRCWTKLEIAYEHKEDERLVPQTLKARDHYFFVLKHKALEGWIDFLVRRREEREHEEVASMHFTARAIPKAFARWKMHTEMERWKGLVQAEADDFHRSNMRTKYFYQWSDVYTRLMDRRTMERMAILHFDERTKAATLRKWRMSLQEIRSAVTKQEAAARFYRTHLLQKYISLWSDYVQDCSHESEGLEKAADHRNRTLLHNAFKLWREFHSTEREEIQKANQAMQCYQAALVRRAFLGWRRFTSWSSTVHTKANKKGARIDLERLGACWRLWREYVSVKVNEKERNLSAVMFSNRTIARKVMRCWHDRAAVLAVKNGYLRAAATHVHRTANTGLVRRTLLAWQTARDNALLLRLKYEHAVQYCERKLKHKALRTLQAHTELTKRKTVLRAKADWLSATRCLRYHFLVWRFEINAREKEMEKSTIALVHWSDSLQYKCLVAWFHYTEERKRKKARYSSALADRSVQLARNGLAQWLSMAENLRTIRLRVTSTQLIQEATSSVNATRRAITHWRSWAKSKAVSRGKAEAHQGLIREDPRRHLAGTAASINHSGQRFLKSPPRSPGKRHTLDLPSSGLSTLVTGTYGPSKIRESELEGRFRSVSPAPSSLPSLPYSMGSPSVNRHRSRSRPRQPSFMQASLERDGLWNDGYPSYPTEPSLTVSPLSPSKSYRRPSHEGGSERCMEIISTSPRKVSFSPARVAIQPDGSTLSESTLTAKGYKDQGQRRGQIPRRENATESEPYRRNLTACLDAVDPCSVTSRSAGLNQDANDAKDQTDGCEKVGLCRDQVSVVLMGPDAFGSSMCSSTSPRPALLQQTQGLLRSADPRNSSDGSGVHLGTKKLPSSYDKDSQQLSVDPVFDGDRIRLLPPDAFAPSSMPASSTAGVDRHGSSAVSVCSSSAVSLLHEKLDLYKRWKRKLRELKRQQETVKVLLKPEEDGCVNGSFFTEGQVEARQIEEEIAALQSAMGKVRNECEGIMAAMDE